MNIKDCLSIAIMVAWLMNFAADFFLYRSTTTRTWCILLISLVFNLLILLAENHWEPNLGSGGLLLVICGLAPFVMRKIKGRDEK